MGNASHKDIDHPIARILFIGMVVSVVFMLVGIILLLMHPGHHSTRILPAITAFRELPTFRVDAWLSIGLLALIVTPLARVIMAVGSFAWIKDWKYTLVSCVVLVAMVMGLLLGNKA